MATDVDNAPGFAPDEVLLGAPTRLARLKWVIVTDGSQPAGQQVNAAACVAAATGAAVTGLLGPAGTDAAGQHHPGLPWPGCTVLTGSQDDLAAIRARAAARADMLVVDMPRHAQATRVYADYLATLSGTKPEDLAPSALSIVGPRNAVAKLVKHLELL